MLRPAASARPSCQTLGVAREGQCNAANGEAQLSAFNAFRSRPARAVRPSAAGARWSSRAAFFNARTMRSWSAGLARVHLHSLQPSFRFNRCAFAARGQPAASSLALSASESRRCCSAGSEGCPSCGGQRAVGSARGVFNATAKYTGAVRVGRYVLNHRHA